MRLYTLRFAFICRRPQEHQSTLKIRVDLENFGIRAPSEDTRAPFYLFWCSFTCVMFRRDTMIREENRVLKR